VELIEKKEVSVAVTLIKGNKEVSPWGKEKAVSGGTWGKSTLLGGTSEGESG